MQIRVATAADAPGINAIYRRFVVDTCVSFELEPPTDDAMAARIAATLSKFPWLACVKQSQVVGYAYAGRHRERPAYQWAAETTVYVAADNQRCGVGRALYQALFELLTRQGYFTLYAGITLPNPASVGLHESLGFQPVGVYQNAGFKLGHWHDVGWWQRNLRAGSVPEGAPRPFSALQSVETLPGVAGKSPTFS